MEDEKEVREVPVSCRDCTNQNLFSLVKLLIYIIGAIALSNNSAEIIQNIWSVVK